MAVWYGLIPIAGGFYSRYKWSRFRKRFDELRLAPLLDYRQYREMKEQDGIFRFTGEIESITDGKTLWVKGENLTMPVSLEKTPCWLLPIQEGEGSPEAPEQIRWNRVSTLTEGAKVYIGGLLKTQDNRSSFVSTKENPLTVIFYNCPDSSLTSVIIRAARTRNEYWNNITPVSLIFGALSLVYIAASFLNRPAFRLTVITAMVAIFLPVFPVIPPGLLLSVLHRRMIWQAKRYKTFLDLARLPLRFLQPGQENSTLGTGEKYGCVKIPSPLPETSEKPVPLLIPELSKERKKTDLYFFGVLNEASPLPEKSKDPFVSFGILPDSPERLARHYAKKAYTMEIFAWVVLLSAIGINIVFIYMILFLLV